MFQKIYGKLISKLTNLKTPVKSLNFSEFPVNFNTAVLEFNSPEFIELKPTYVLIRNLKYHPDVKIITLPPLESLIKWKFLNLNFSVLFRDYPLKMISNLKEIVKERIFLKLPPKVKYFEQKQINITKKIKVTEEIIQILPYTKEAKKQKLFKVPIERTPLYKSYFSETDMRKFREDLAVQNNTRWSNIEILEIYDKFNVKLFSDIKQSASSRNLFCYPKVENLNIKIDDEFYYLIIGKRRDTEQLVNALSRPVINEADSKNV